MPTAEIIAIGTELLLGITQDTNTRFLAQELNRFGVDLFRTTIIGDNCSRITQSIQEALQRADLVITCGGLGPTIDDPTREAAANAFNEELIFHPQLWQSIQARFNKLGRAATENNKRQAFIPKNAEIIENPVGTAPSFSIEKGDNLLVCLPGVPAELVFLFQNAVTPIIKQKYDLHQTIFTKIVRTCGLGESRVDELVADLEKMTNPTVGLSAHPGMVDIRITAKSKDGVEADQLIQPILGTIQERLADYIFGYDEDRLDSIIREKISKNGTQIALILTASTSYLESKLNQLQVFYKILPTQFNGSELVEKIIKMHTDNEFIMGLDQSTEEGYTLVRFHWLDKSMTSIEDKSFASHPTLLERWLINMTLDYLRRKLNSKETK
jgi:nicotinamide-nucleotide amidase